MTKFNSLIVLSALAMGLLITSCKKTATNPTPMATVIFNDTTTVVADSVHWDYYSPSQTRLGIYKGGVAICTLYPTSIVSGTYSLGYQYLYWIVKSPVIYTVNSSGGTLTIANSSNVLSGSFSAYGNVFSGAAAAPPSKVSATFSNVRELGK